MTFGRQVIDFHRELKPNWVIPDGIDLIFPFANDETLEVFASFYNKYFADHHSRTYLFGINPGRFGAGLTGIPFTDPQVLQEQCGIKNKFKKRHELSSVFVYDVIDVFGGIEHFYSKFYITSICPLGFLKDGKNWNYYDSRNLTVAVEKYIIENIQSQIKFGCNRQVAFSMGKGKNYAYLKKLNDRHSFFEKIKPLPHPRWVMQYRLKQKEKFIDEYLLNLDKP